MWDKNTVNAISLRCWYWKVWLGLGLLINDGLVFVVQGEPFITCAMGAPRGPVWEHNPLGPPLNNKQHCSNVGDGKPKGSEVWSGLAASSPGRCEIGQRWSKVHAWTSRDTLWGIWLDCPAGKAESDGPFVVFWKMSTLLKSLAWRGLYSLFLLARSMLSLAYVGEECLSLDLSQALVQPDVLMLHRISQTEDTWWSRSPLCDCCCPTSSPCSGDKWDISHPELRAPCT